MSLPRPTTLSPLVKLVGMTAAADNPYLALAYRRALTSQDPALVQVSFDIAVLDKYRGAAGFSLMRMPLASSGPELT
jgi:hypothetical protein